MRFFWVGSNLWGGQNFVFWLESLLKKSHSSDWLNSIIAMLSTHSDSSLTIKRNQDRLANMSEHLAEGSFSTKQKLKTTTKQSCKISQTMRTGFV